MALNDWRKQERRPGGASKPAQSTARPAGYFAGEHRKEDMPVATSGEGGVVEQAERVGLQGAAQRWSAGRDQLALIGTATGESSATIARKMGKYDSLISGGTGGGGTRISAQSFSAGSQKWAGRVGTDRSAPGSFGNASGLRSMWEGGGLGGAGSLKYRWDASGNLNSAGQQQAAFDKSKTTAVVEDTRPENVDGSYAYAGSIMGSDGWLRNADGSVLDPFGALASLNDMNAGNELLMKNAYSAASAEYAKRYAFKNPWEID